MAVSWSYNGSDTLTAIVSGATDGDHYNLVCDDPNSEFNDAVASGGTVTLTVSTIGGLSSGDMFGAYISHGDSGGIAFDAPLEADNAFTFGTSSTTGDGATVAWTYDGNLAVSATFTALGSVTYNLNAGPAGGFDNIDGGPYTAGTSHTINLTLSATGSGVPFYAALTIGSGGGPAVSTRLLASGSPGTNVAGNPNGSGADNAPVPGNLTERVQIGFDANMLDPDPAWTAIDTLGPSLVARIEINDGRQTEQDETETGTGAVWLNDRAGLFDPNNVASPYFGKLDGKPIRFMCWNPVDLEWVQQARHTIDDVQYVLDPATQDGVSINANIRIETVDMFDYLARAEMRVGTDGNTPPAGSEGTVFYEDGPVANPGGPPGRIEQLLIDAGIDTTMFVVFSGNVNVLESLYDPGDEFLTALKDAADAEFPGIANQYVDKLGRYVFHGRFARLDPDSVIADGPVSTDVWDFHRWKAGDGAAIQADAACAQIREFSFARPRDLLINAAIAYPEKNTDGTPLLDADIPGQLVQDATSIGKYGIHGRTDANLIVKSHKTNGDTGLDQCLKYATFWKTYYANPLTRIERIVFKSVHPDDHRAATTWALLTGVSISDTVDIFIGYPGGTGIQGDRYYVEGRHMTIEPLQPAFDMVTLELNLSPAITDTEGIFS